MLGGHSLRLAGARLLSSAGLRLYQVELMARWKSPMLLHYAQTAPLKRLTQEYETANDRLNTHRIIEQLKEQMQQLQQISREPNDHGVFESRVNHIEQQLKLLDDKTTDMTRTKIAQVKTSLIRTARPKFGISPQ